MTCAIVDGAGPNSCASAAGVKKWRYSRRLRIGNLLRLRRQRRGIARLERDGEGQGRRRRCGPDQGGPGWNEALMAGQPLAPDPGGNGARRGGGTERGRAGQDDGEPEHARCDEAQPTHDGPIHIHPCVLTGAPRVGRGNAPPGPFSVLACVRARVSRAFAESLFLRCRHPTGGALGIAFGSRARRPRTARPMPPASGEELVRHDVRRAGVARRPGGIAAEFGIGPRRRCSPPSNKSSCSFGTHERSASPDVAHRLGRRGSLGQGQVVTGDAVPAVPRWRRSRSRGLVRRPPRPGSHRASYRVSGR